METGKSTGPTSGLISALGYEFLGSALITWAYNLTLKDAWLRAVAYFIGYIFAVNVSGAHFNPAISLAVYLTERKNENLTYLLLVMFTQLCGCYFGILVAYLLLKDYVTGNGTWSQYNLNSYTLYPIPPGNAGR